MQAFPAGPWFCVCWWGGGTGCLQGRRWWPSGLPLQGGSYKICPGSNPPPLFPTSLSSSTFLLLQVNMKQSKDVIPCKLYYFVSFSTSFPAFLLLYVNIKQSKEVIPCNSMYYYFTISTSIYEFNCFPDSQKMVLS